MTSRTERLLNFKETHMDPISPTFCAAKWHRTNVRLDHGVSYSCHHCKQEKIDLSHLKDDPSQLTNTPAVLKHRDQMLDGERPPECEYCWQAEDKGEISDRIIKTHDLYNRNIKNHPNYLEDIVANTKTAPKILEVCFDNTCNFKCAYCSPVCSSKWSDELRRHGAFPTKTTRTMPGDIEKILNREDNPYTEAFWEWWPELKETLTEIRITGGEPLMNKRLYQLFDLILDDADDLNLDVAINTNFCPPAGMFDKFISYINRVSEKTKKVKVFTSLESTGDNAEYGRTGLVYDEFVQNVDTFLNETDNTLFFMLTNNALSITGLLPMLEYYVELRQKWGNRIAFTSHMVRTPAYLDIRVLPEPLLKHYNEELQKFVDTNGHHFSPDGLIQLQRTIDYMLKQGEFMLRKKTEVSFEQLQMDFVNYVDEHDNRRGTNFLVTYPELASFYHSIKSLNKIA